MTNHDYNNFQIARDERGVVAVTLDVPERPVNVFDEGVLVELESIVAGLEQDADAKAVVFRSGKESGFLAGADVKQIASVESAEAAREIVVRGQSLFARIEALPMPTLAVVHGPCLGGGLEFGLACRSRVARDDASTRLGLPEVQLGLLPAWGGTQRLPRLVGLVPALSMILKGSKLSPEKAQKLGLVDRIAPPAEFESLVETVVAQLLKDPGLVTARQRRCSALARVLNNTRLGRWLVFRTTKRQVGSQVKNYPALAEALEAVRRGMQVSREEGFAYEQEAFGRLLFTPTCRNLLGLFFQRERARKTATWVHESSEPARHIETIGVVGAGAMGAGIAQLAAYRGLPVAVKEIDQQALDAGMARIRRLFDAAVEGGRMSRDEADERLAAVTPTTDWSPLAGCDLVIEAVVEREDVKREVFRQLEQHVEPEALLATNTSSLSVARLAEAVERLERVAGLHFFNPVHRMELVEVVRTSQTSDATVEPLVRLVRRLGKTPVVVADSPGFLVNRILFPYLAEAVRMVCEGVDAREVDRAVKRFGMPVGPLELLDQVGLDVSAHVAQSLAPARDGGEPIAERLSAMVARGWLGKKSGRGFYEYRKGRRARPSDRGQLPGAQPAPSPPATRSSRGADRLIEQRVVLPMINEAARCLQEGVVAQPWVVDLAMVLGTGFAPFRGGPLRLADQRGIAEVVAELRELEREYGPRFAPCQRLTEMERNQSRFYDEPSRVRKPLTV